MALSFKDKNKYVIHATKVASTVLNFIKETSNASGLDHEQNEDFQNIRNKYNDTLHRLQNVSVDSAYPAAKDLEVHVKDFVDRQVGNGKTLLCLRIEKLGTNIKVR